MKKLLSIILSITMLVSPATVAFADGVDGPMQKTKIKVATSADFKPFEYYDEGETLTGFDIDLMNYIGERIGFDIEFVNMSFDKLIPAVVNGEVACAISGITITKERESVIDYTTPYLVAQSEVDGELQYEQYAIVFPDNFVQKAKLAEAAGQEFIYTLVNDAVSELIEDATVEKLIQKYELNSNTQETGYSYYVLDSRYNEFVDTDNNYGTGHLPTGDTAIVPLSDWAKDSVIKATDLGIMEAGKKYDFLKPITREEFCELIYNYCGNVLGMLSTSDGKRFNDTDNPKIEVLSAMGIINGKTATEFAPNDALTREEAAVILQRMVNATVPVSATEMWFEFDDITYISDWAMDAVQTMCNMNVMNGVGNNNFAPQEVYTTEQAIVTITRVYSAQTAEFREDFGTEEPIENIIGGADGPTSIIVGDNSTVIDGADAPTKITVTDTIKVDDFYIDEALKLITESAELAADKEFISYYTISASVSEQISELANTNYSKPTEIYYMAANREKIIDNIKALSDDELDGFDIEKLLKLNKVDFSVIGNMINASYGAENLAALTILTNSRGYIMPKDFTGDFALYLQYDGEYSALVSFSKFGDGVIKATMSFVNNGDRDNIFSRLYEITQGLGEDSIDVASCRGARTTN